MAEGVRADGGLSDPARAVRTSRRRRASPTSAPPNTATQSRPATDEVPTGKRKARGETRRRRGIKAKASLSGKVRTDAETNDSPGAERQRRAPGPQPNKTGVVGGVDKAIPAAAPRPRPTLPAPTPYSRHPEFDWRTWAVKQRRVLLGTGLGFLAGLLVYAILSPGESPTPAATPAIGETRAGARERIPSKAMPERPTGDLRQAPAATYGLPASPGAVYGPGLAPGPGASTGYPPVGYPSSPATTQAYAPDRYRPLVAEEAVPADVWPSPERRSTQRTFRQSLDTPQYGAQRPWGAVGDRRSASQGQPPFSDYPGLVDPYAPLPSYPVRPGDYPPQGLPAPY